MALAAGLLAVLVLLFQAAGWQICLFHRLTGLPCPTCGATRAAFALLRGDWAGAWGWHPPAALLLPGLALYLAVGTISWVAYGRFPVLRGSVREWIALAAVITALLLFNWMYALSRT